MKQKRHRYRNRMLAIKGRPQFRLQEHRLEKGKGSYVRSDATQFLRDVESSAL
ncbi:hypothetical protein QWY82_08280 [Simiduia curdlanivorans]|uniref:Ribosome alternative rescue factor ArfA n=1 Tax=Simiduia curdlanivorans TaxID=1492769 RepID=A0ABV8V7J3_9GAMM|nr:hypothetical protein [Simiduia curdlanivorans]MDN3638802.1 hypothetical protein [Simiduia curdlanivorans]